MRAAGDCRRLQEIQEHFQEFAGELAGEVAMERMKAGVHIILRNQECSGMIQYCEIRREIMGFPKRKMLPTHLSQREIHYFPTDFTIITLYEI